MKKVFIGLSALLLIMVGVFFTTKNASANEGGLPYLVEPILPHNQDKGIDNYISISPNSNSLKQELEFLVSNKTDKKQKINVKLFNAYTSASGGIQYTAEGTDDNLIINDHYEMRQYIQAPEQIELQGGEIKVVRLELDIPETEGTVLGAVAFQGEGESEESEQEGISFEIKNEINTVYGIAINFPTKQSHTFDFDKPFVDPMPSYYTVRLPITLDSPLLLKDVEIDYEVEFKGEKLFFSKESIDFAPMTKTNFAIPFDYEEIQKNKPYILKGSLTYKDKNGAEQIEDFEFKFEYVVKKDKANNTIAKVLKAPIEKSGLPYWALILLLISVVGYIVYLRLRKKYFVLYSDESPLFIVGQDHPNFEKIQPKSRAINEHKYKFTHYYLKKKNKYTNEYYYAYHQTKNNKNVFEKTS
ncbi:DUF916 domain-containing protein [Butyricicoccus sp. 1XD8-22]|nr:DUF916 domain-containing protein [Butyricicoccus sp. 1XD8-22]